MNDRTINSLEFDKILAKLSAHAESGKTKERITPAIISTDMKIDDTTLEPYVKHGKSKSDITTYIRLETFGYGKEKYQSGSGSPNEKNKKNCHLGNHKKNKGDIQPSGMRGVGGRPDII